MSDLVENHIVGFPTRRLIYINNAAAFQEEDDLAYEEDILRNPYSVKCWLRYIEHKKDGSKNALNLIFERALKELPGR